MVHQSFFFSGQLCSFSLSYPPISLRWKLPHYSVRAADFSPDTRISGAGKEKTVVHTFSQTKLPPQLENKLGPIVCIHVLPMRKSSLSNIARGESQTRERSKTRENATATDTKGQCPTKISHWNQPCKPSWFHQSVTSVILLMMTESEQERNRANERVGSVCEIQYNTSCSPYGEMSDSSASPSHDKLH